MTCYKTLLCGGVAAVVCVGAQAHAQARRFDIPAQPAVTAIPEFAQQAQIQVIAPARDLAGVSTPAVRGEMDVRAALRQLISGTPLHIARDEGAIITLRSNLRAPGGKSGGLSGRQIDLPADAAPMASDASQVEELVVVGGRLLERRAVAARRESTQIMDSVTSDELGRLPDYNIAEALQRLPGIAFQDNRGEPRFVTVRGLAANYNLTLVDGVSVAVPDGGGRRMLMDVLPASLAASIDVYKSFTPNLEGGAVAGLIDIKTRGAFGQKPGLRIEAEVGEDLLNRDGPKGSKPRGGVGFNYAGTFGSSDQFGLVVYADYQKRTLYTPQAEYAGSSGTRYYYGADGKDAGQPGTVSGTYPGVAEPVLSNRRWHFYYNERDRYSGGGRLEYRSGNDDVLFVRGFLSNAKDDEVRQTSLWEHSGGGALTNRTAHGGTITGAASAAIREYPVDIHYDRAVWALTAGGDHKPAIADVSWRLNYSGAKHRETQELVEWQQKSAVAGAFTYERIGNVYTMAPVNPDQFYNYNNYAAVRQLYENRSLDADIYEAKLDLGRDLDVTGGGWRLAGGLGARREDRGYDEDFNTYNPATGNAFTLAASGALEKDSCLRPPGALKGQCMVVIDPGVALRSFFAHLAANPGQWINNPQLDDDQKSDYGMKETVLSGYGMIRYAGQRWNLTAGVRYEDTSTEATGRRKANGVWGDTQNKGGYHDFLPSMTVDYRVNDQLRIRSAYSRTVGRPAFSDVAPRGETLNNNESGYVLSRANPNLRPRRSDNLDLAFDWFFPKNAGVVSLSLFYKNMKDEFLTTTEDMTIDWQGSQVTATVTQKINAGEPIDFKGVELNVVRDLDFVLPHALRGFTISGNVTYVDVDFFQTMSDGKIHQPKTMSWQPDITGNAALSYDRGPLSMRVAYTYSGETLVATNNSTASRNKYRGDQGLLSLSSNYRFNDNLMLRLTANNLTNQKRTEWVGWNQEIPQLTLEMGRSYAIGLTYRY